MLFPLIVQIILDSRGLYTNFTHIQTHTHTQTQFIVSILTLHITHSQNSLSSLVSGSSPQFPCPPIYVHTMTLRTSFPCFSCICVSSHPWPCLFTLYIPYMTIILQDSGSRTRNVPVPVRLAPDFSHFFCSLRLPIPSVLL